MKRLARLWEDIADLAPEIIGTIGAVIVLTTTWHLSPPLGAYLTGLGLIGLAWAITVTRRPPS